MSNRADELRAKILDLVSEYHEAAFAPTEFDAEKTQVAVAGKAFDSDDLGNLVEASLDFWLTTGRFAAEFQRNFAQFMGVMHALLVNSGSSANLLALSCLTSPSLGDRQLKPGDEVITVAAGFTTTVSPIVQNRLVPVFVDIDIPTYNLLDASLLEEALSDRTRAIMLAHTLGNTFDIDAVTAFAKKHNLWLIEDCCDATGTTYNGKKVGRFGHLASVSFYPAHHITMGEGGCVLTDDPALARLVKSFRDWGRDCWCEPGSDDTCGRRFDQQFGKLPQGYDHKYTFSHIGYNLKATDMQAAVGVSQLKKLPGFIEQRKKNYAALRAGMEDLEEFFILPEATPGADPSWFGFPLAVRPEAPFTRDRIVQYLETNRVATRLLFGGNLLRQPAYLDTECRVIGDLANSDFVTGNVFWIGVYPGLGGDKTGYMLDVLHRSAKDSM